jgi:hypothetical protein
MRIQNRNFKRFRFKGFAVLVLLLFLVSCSKEDSWNFKEVGTLLWIGEKHSDEAIKTAIKNTLENSSIIIAQVSWSPNDTNFFQNTDWYFNLAKDHGKSFMVNVDWQETDRSGTNGGWSFTDKKAANLFRDDIMQLIKTYNPSIINLGVEANYYALTSEDGFKAFIGLFREIKNKINDFDPRIKVGLSYQLELLYGHHSGWDQVQTLRNLDVILGDIDFLGISTYPNMAVQSSNNILFASNYIDSLAFRYSIPFGISETAASSSLYNAEERMIYMKAIYEKAERLDLRFVIWGSIIDSPQSLKGSDKLGLIDNLGIPKQELVIWQNENKKLTK